MLVLRNKLEQNRKKTIHFLYFEYVYQLYLSVRDKNNRRIHISRNISVREFRNLWRLRYHLYIPIKYYY